MEQDRFDETNHWAFFDDKPSRSLCKIKDCHNLTHVFCQKCQVHLCLNQTRNCFHRFHQRDIDLLQFRKKLKITPRPTQSLDGAEPEMPKPIVAAMQPMIETSKRDYKSNSSKCLQSGTQSKSTKPARKSRNSEKPNIKDPVAKKYSLRSTSALLISKRRATRVSTGHDMDSSSGSDEEAFFHYLKLNRT